jgi:hypothetical protein
MFSIRSIALATTAAAALVPAVASANTYCVYAPGCNGKAEWTLQDAISDVASDSGASRIELGPGTYSGNFVVPNHAPGLEIVGAGAEQTVLEPTAAGSYALELHGGSLSQVGFSLPPIGGNGARGLDLVDGASADHIRAVITGADMAEPVRIERGGHLSHANIDAGNWTGVFVGSDTRPGDATITDSYVRGSHPIVAFNADHDLVASRDHLVTTGGGQALITVEGNSLLEDSRVDLSASSGSALYAYANTTAAATVEGRRLTVFGKAGTTGAAVYSSSSGGPAKATLTDSVLLDVVQRSERLGNGTAALAMARVDTWPAAPDKANGAPLTDEGSFSADPLLDAGFTPGPGSPLIDAAAPLGADESATDLIGTARSLDGDGSCDARPDIGALESAAAACVPPPAPPPVDAQPQPQPAPHDAVAPRVTRLRVAHRRAVRFTVSEAARVTVRVTRAHRRAIVLRRSAAAGGVTLKLRHALRHGRYAIRVTAVDAAGNRSAPAVVRPKL